MPWPMELQIKVMAIDLDVEGEDILHLLYLKISVHSKDLILFSMFS